MEGDDCFTGDESRLACIAEDVAKQNITAKNIVNEYKLKSQLLVVRSDSIFSV